MFVLLFRSFQEPLLPEDIVRWDDLSEVQLRFITRVASFSRSKAVHGQRFPFLNIDHTVGPLEMSFHLELLTEFR